MIEVESRTKALKVLDLRRQGFTFDQIAERLGYSNRSGAYHAFNRLLTAYESESVEELRTLVTQRMERLIHRSMKAAMSGSRDAAEVLLAAQREINKIHGVYAPTKQEHTGKDGGPIAVVTLDEIDAVRAACIANDDSPSPAAKEPEELH